MNYLLDTCVISEYTRREPNSNVVRWVDEREETGLFLSTITIGEIKKGIELLPADSRRKQALVVWLASGLVVRFSGRIYPLTVEVMLLWGSLYARLETSGQTMATLDSLIAATALFHHAVLVTRNEDHFRPAGVELINPWKLTGPA
jgi:predicted nucleic acid-binding protein